MGGSLTAIKSKREETRKSTQRAEARHLKVIEQAVVTFQRRKYQVRVLNVSSRGAMVEGELEEPIIGARLDIQFNDCNRTECSVRWVRGSRIGLEFCKETLIIAPPK